MAETVVYTLSTVDQSIIRTYIRLALVFHCSEEKQVEAGEKLLASTKRAVSYMPMLAGKVYLITNEPRPLDRWRRSLSISSADDDQIGKVEVRVSPTDVEKFQANIRCLGATEFQYDFDNLASHEMPAVAFIDETKVLTPLPDMPAESGSPVFAIQANFVQGKGLIVAMYLHHSAADLQGLASVIRYMSISEEMLPTREIDYDLLLKDALLQSATRKRLRDAMGVPANLSEHPEYDTQNLAVTPTATTVTDTAFGGMRLYRAPPREAARVLGISTKMLDATRVMVNERFHNMKDMPSVNLTNYDIISTLLWKVITRARFPLGHFANGQRSTLIFPVNIRSRMSPPLGSDYYGNACMFATASQSTLNLSLPFDVGSVADTATHVRLAFSAMTEQKVRSGIAIIEQRDDVRTLNHPRIDFDNDVFLTTWSDLPTGDESTLGLGLGPAQWMRKPSREHASYGCVMLPVKDEEWPILFQLDADVMLRVLDDSGFGQFIRSVA